MILPRNGCFAVNFFGVVVLRRGKCSSRMNRNRQNRGLEREGELIQIFGFLQHCCFWLFSSDVFYVGGREKFKRVPRKFQRKRDKEENGLFVRICLFVNKLINDSKQQRGQDEEERIESNQE